MTIANGIGLFNITQSNVIGVNFVVLHGNEIEFKDSFSAQDTQSTVLHFDMEISNITESRIYVHALKYYSFMTVTFYSCLLKDVYVQKGFESGIVSAVFTDCTFLGKDYSVGIAFIGAQLVIITNTTIQSYGKFCIRGCSIYMEGSDLIEKGIPGLKEKAELLARPLPECDFTDSRLLIENTIITGKIYTGASVIYTADLMLEMVNCVFNMSRVNEEGGLLYTSSKFSNHYVKMSNITVIGTSLKKPTILFSLKQGVTWIQDSLLICPQSLDVVVQTKRAFTILYRCEYSCPNEFYTFHAGHLAIIKEIYYRWSPKESLVRKSEVSCIPCPVGAYCDKQFKALPNYWGYYTRDGNITMIRCPDYYCCSGNNTCKQFNSCSTERIGILCGTCKNNLTESLFSNNCIPQENCFGYVIFILYFVLVVVYGSALLIFTILKENMLHILKYVWKLCKNKFNMNNLQGTSDRTVEEIAKFETKSRTHRDKNIELHNIGNRKDSNLQVLTERTIKFEPHHSKYDKDTGKKETGSQFNTVRKAVSEPSICSHQFKFCHTTRDNTILEESNITKSQDKKENSMKYLQILFYYVQDAALFKVKLPVDDSRKTETIIVKILQFSPDALAVFQKYSNVCFSYGTSAVSKIVMKSVFGPCVMLFLLISFLYFENIHRNAIQNFLSLYHAGTNYLTQTFLLVFLMSYQQIITGAFTLVQCIEVQEQNVLYIQGNIQCYTWWQIVIKTFLVLNIFPLLLVLSNFPFHLKGKKISNKCFFLSCVFPIPGFIYFLCLKKYKAQKGNLESNLYGRSTVEKDKGLKVVDAILHTLLDHYKCIMLFGFRFTWFGVHKLYRLLLVVCNTCILEPIPKLSAMITILIFITILNGFLKPYKDSKANKTAALSYMANICIAIINFWKTALVTFDCKTNCFFKTIILEYFQLCESIPLVWLPLSAIALWTSFTAIAKLHSKIKKS